jgi:hypothetical protein
MIFDSVCPASSSMCISRSRPSGLPVRTASLMICRMPSIASSRAASRSNPPHRKERHRSLQCERKTAASRGAWLIGSSQRSGTARAPHTHKHISRWPLARPANNVIVRAWLDENGNLHDRGNEQATPPLHRHSTHGELEYTVLYLRLRHWTALVCAPERGRVRKSR